MGADCKSVGLRLPRFESWICHQGRVMFSISATGRNAVSVRRASAAESKASATVEREPGGLVVEKSLADFHIRART
jgi:hypothetical protein